MITTVNHILDFLHAWAPQHLKADYDNVGLLVGDPQQQTTGVLTCLDVTPEVVDEAAEMGFNLIVAHHPLIFRKLAAVRADQPVGRIVTDLIRRDIAVIAAHTNLDSAEAGVSFVLAEQLGLIDLRFLETGREGGGYGVIGQYDSPLDRDFFLARCAEALGVPALRYSGNAQAIDTVAVCGGAGAFLMDAARQAGAQAYVTADLKYHDFFNGDASFLLCDAGHYETEMPVSTRLAERIRSAFDGLDVRVTRQVTNPVRYYRHHSSEIIPLSKP